VSSTYETEAVMNPRSAEERHRLLSRTWGEPPGFIGWFRNVNHKEIGKR
jgi:hypothetical protein